MQQEQSISNQNLSDSRLSRFGFHSKKPSDSAFYKAFFSMYPLLVLQNVVTLSVNLADNMMLGAYGESALSGAAAVNQIQFVYQCLLTALGDGLVMFGSQYWGKKQLSPLRKIAASAMHFGLLLPAGQHFPDTGASDFHDGFRHPRTGRTVSEYYPFYLPVLCNHTDSARNPSKRGNRRHCVPAFLYGTTCQLFD